MTWPSGDRSWTRCTYARAKPPIGDRRRARASARTASALVARAGLVRGGPPAPDKALKRWFLPRNEGACRSRLTYVAQQSPKEARRRSAPRAPRASLLARLGSVAAHAGEDAPDDQVHKTVVDRLTREP